MSKTIEQFKKLDLNRFLQEELPIRDAIINHGTTLYDDSKGYPGEPSIQLSYLYRILDDEESSEEMDFGYEELNAFIQKHDLRLVPRAFNSKTSILTETKKVTERTGKQIFKEIEALQILIEAHQLDFTDITLGKATHINNRIRQILQKELGS